MKLPRIPAIRPEELAFALKLADAAGAARIPMSGVGDKAVTIDMGDGTQTEFGFADTPMMRAMFAVKEQFGDRWQAVMMRAWAFADVCDDPRIQDWTWVPEGAASGKIDDSVLDIAAVMPLNPKGLFNRNTFFRRVADCADEFAGPPHDVQKS